MPNGSGAAWLDSLINYERSRRLPYEELGLGRIRRLAEKLGDPQRALSVIHIAGSKGKGSTALLAEAVLRAAGERVGTFTSPHLERWTERFRIDGEEVSEERLFAATEQVRPHVEALRAEGITPSFFDAVTAAAFVLFREAGVDRAVLEVGLGGRLDSTNLVVPAVTCITSIELEHTEQLGDTLGAIAREKAGILKQGVPLVLGRVPREAEVEICERAKSLDVPVARLGRDFEVEILESGVVGQRLRFADGGLCCEAELPVLGAHQAGNAALALACMRRARVGDDASLARAACEGLSRVALPGRIELLGRKPWILVDGAHTAASARELARVLEQIPHRRTHLVLSISAGKDTTSLLEALLPAADVCTVTRAEPRRSLAPTEVARFVRETRATLQPRIVPNPHMALRAALEDLGPEDLLCVTGSVYLAGLARAALADSDRSAHCS